jgi:dTDP-4-amino-4,6-dideoxygalactose transaminase
MIPFNKPYLTGKETEYIQEAVQSGHLSGNGKFTQKCQTFFEQRYGFKKVLLTTSGTDALEMAALLINIQPGDEVIVPAYTFVSTANAFALRGATIVFADSNALNPNIDADQLETLITSRTKAIVPVHYAGIACDMDKIMALARKYQLYVIEDAAQAIDSYYISQDGTKKALGSIGHLAAFSFHETKNIISGEGGMLVINRESLLPQAEIIWEKGTDRAAFFRGETAKYQWVALGSSFLPSEITAAFLWAQLEKLDQIQTRRTEIWQQYTAGLKELAELNRARLPYLPTYATNNAHRFYLVCADLAERTALLAALKAKNIHAVFHYLALHQSPYFHHLYRGKSLPYADYYTDTLLRPPFFYELETEAIAYIMEVIRNFYSARI